MTSTTGVIAFFELVECDQMQSRENEGGDKTSYPAKHARLTYRRAVAATMI